jgi:hypothetical protein
MAALVQSFPQQAATVTMMSPGPSSPGGYQPGPSRQSHSHQPPRSSQLSQTMYGGAIPSVGVYRGQTSQSPVAPYAFTTTPALTNTTNLPHAQSSPQLRQENRAPSSTASSYGQGNNQGTSGERQSNSMSKPHLPSPVTESPRRGREMMSKDDSALSTNRRIISPAPRPLSSLAISNSMPFPPPVGVHSSAKPSPERYRRPNRRPELTGPASSFGAGTPAQPGSVIPPGTGAVPVGGNISDQSSQQSTLAPSRLQHSRSSSGLSSTERPVQVRTASVDDMQLNRQPLAELAKRYRRRSTSGLDTVDLVQFRDGSSPAGSGQGDQSLPSPARTAPSDGLGAPAPIRPGAGHTRTASSESTTDQHAGNVRKNSKVMSIPQ